MRGGSDLGKIGDDWFRRRITSAQLVTATALRERKGKIQTGESKGYAATVGLSKTHLLA